VNRPPLFQLRCFCLSFCVIVLLLAWAKAAVARPRPPAAPPPEFARLLWHEGFDRAYSGGIRDAQFSIADYGVLNESWSGYSLQRSGKASAFIVPAVSKSRTKVGCDTGAIRFWFRPYWDSVGGPGVEGRLLTLVSLADKEPFEAWSLQVSTDGSAIYLLANRTAGAEFVLKADVAFQAGQWNLVSLNYALKGTALFINGRVVAEGAALSSVDPKSTVLVVGSSLAGNDTPEAEFDEISAFAAPLSGDAVAAYYDLVSPIAALGPVTAEEQQASRLASTQFAADQKASGSGQRMSVLENPATCESELAISADASSVTVTIQNADNSKTYEIYRTLELLGTPTQDSDWRFMARGTAGQSFTFRNPGRGQGFFVAVCQQDSDNDGLSDAFETLISKTDPEDPETYGILDLDWYLASNVPVNDPADDWANAQNTQFETTVAVSGNNVIVAYVDSNHGLYGIGQESLLSAYYPPRFVGYSVSIDGGLTFTDMDAPPLDSGALGDGGDPVLAVDRATSGLIYLTGTSPRESVGSPPTTAWIGVPFWKSTDGGITFQRQATIRTDIAVSDKPTIAVDDFSGTGQHDLYVAVSGQVGTIFGLWLTVSTDQGTTWSSPAAIPASGSTVTDSPIIVIDANHVAYVVWFEYLNGVDYLKIRSVTSRGASLGTIRTVRQLAITDSQASLFLARTNSSSLSDDTFRALAFPVAAANPSSSKAGHLYIAFTDKGSGSDKADVFFTRSTDGGVNWTTAQRLNSDSTGNDQWMPVMCVKPDGTRLFVAWYDRRNDSGNSLIDVYARWGTIASDGSVSFGSDFRVSTLSFPPVFAGTLPDNAADGHYDPVYPPGGVNLHWWWTAWPAPAIPPDPEDNGTSNTYARHVGEYNTAWSDESYVHLVWTDSRLPSRGSPLGLYRQDPNDPDSPETYVEVPLLGNQRDVRFVRLGWPQ